MSSYGLVFALVCSVVAIVYGAISSKWILAQPDGNARMREIADACGISKPGLYYHFKDKEDLFLAILDQNLNDLEQIVAEAGSQPGGTMVSLLSNNT